MAKIMLVGKRHWSNTDRKTLELVEGESYIGYLKGGQAIQFTSLEDYPIHEGEVVFNDSLAIEINLLTNLFDGKVKYKDGASYGEKE